MTTPEPTPYDTSNALLAAGPAILTMSEVMTTTGKLGVATIRTQSTTLSVFLPREDMQAWADAFQKQANQLTGLLLVPPGATLSAAQVAQR